jgi:hypothetical protein
MSFEHPPHESSKTPETIVLPAPTAWPIVMAFGTALLFAGLVTTASVSILGAILFVAGAVGWFTDILPHEKHEVVRVEAETITIQTSRMQVQRLPVAPELARAYLPLETYPVSAGVKGGLAGGVAMAVLAGLYGIIRQHSLWYPINLLAATIYAQGLRLSQESLHTFHFDSFAMACVIHLIVSLLVGLLYGAMLPMFPRRPIVLGGLVAPIVWTALLYNVMGILNPMLNERVDWKWFFASQVAFGIVAGLIVVRQERVQIGQVAPFAVRAGIEAPGIEQKTSRPGQLK